MVRRMRQDIPITYGHSGLHRDARDRRNSEGHWRDPRAAVVPFWAGKPLIELGAGSARLSLWPCADFAHEVAVLLGLEGRAPLFAVDMGDDTTPPPSLGTTDPNRKFIDLRSIALQLSPAEANAAAQARSMLEWHRTHPFCARCGARSSLADAGYRRDCTSCGAQHFPRTDPVVIMLLEHAGRALVAAKPGWPMQSIIAGFVEPGETIENAVRREAREEVGIEVGAVRYVLSQPWPFPGQLMIACIAEAKTDQITLDTEELETAFWITKAEALAAFAGQPGRFTPPRADAVARVVLEHWARNGSEP